MLSRRDIEPFLADGGDAAGRTARAGPAASPSPIVPFPQIVRPYLDVGSHSAADLRHAVHQCGGNKSQAAQRLGLTARQFAYRWRKAGLDQNGQVMAFAILSMSTLSTLCGHWRGVQVTRWCVHMKTRRKTAVIFDHCRVTGTLLAVPVLSDAASASSGRPDTAERTTLVNTAARTVATTSQTYLRPIDRDGLLTFAANGCAHPEKRGTNVVRTVTDGQFRTLSYVGSHQPVVVDEPLHLFGQNTAPAPGEMVLSALGGCLAVGITAVATWKQVKLSRLEVLLEGDIGNPAAWGAGGAAMQPPADGLSADPREGGHRRRCQPRATGRDRAARELLLSRCEYHAQSDPLHDRRSPTDQARSRARRLRPFLSRITESDRRRPA